MSRLLSFISEVFSKSDRDVYIQSNDDSQVSIAFEVDGTKYQFVADHQDYDGLWEISFWRYDEDDGVSRTNLINTMNATQVLKIFNKVFFCIETLIHTRNPKTIELTAAKKEQSRVKLYKKLVVHPKIKSIFGKYKLETVDLSQDIKFVIKRW